MRRKGVGVSEFDDVMAGIGWVSELDDVMADIYASQRAVRAMDANDNSPRYPPTRYPPTGTGSRDRCQGCSHPPHAADQCGARPMFTGELRCMCPEEAS